VSPARVGGSKLTEADVATILAELAAGTTGADLSRRFGVDQSIISLIRHRKIWKHVPCDVHAIPARSRAKLTEADVAVILSELAKGTAGRELARRFGVGDTAISQIRHGEQWKHVPRDGLVIPARSRAKLTEADVVIILSELAKGTTQKELARRFGVGQMTIRYIRYAEVFKRFNPAPQEESEP
jgi:uncharacterized protein (DUF433 family)